MEARRSKRSTSDPVQGSWCVAACPRGSPCLTTALSEGFAALATLSCCNMSARWQSTGSPSSRSAASSSFSWVLSKAGLSRPEPEEKSRATAVLVARRLKLAEFQEKLDLPSHQAAAVCMTRPIGLEAETPISAMSRSSASLILLMSRLLH